MRKLRSLNKLQTVKTLYYFRKFGNKWAVYSSNSTVPLALDLPYSLARKLANDLQLGRAKLRLPLAK
jgi:hypothetical protein